MEIKVKWPLIVFVVLLFVSLALYVKSIFDTRAESKSLFLLQNISNLEEKETLLESKNKSLENVISSIDEENKNLLSQIALLKSRKEKIKYIDVIKYKTKEVVVVKENLPPSFIYRTEEGMPICSFEYKENYIFKVIPTEYKLDLVKSDKSTSVVLKAKPAEEKEYYTLPVEINESSSVKIKKFPRIEPNLSVGIALSYSNNLQLSPVFQVPFIHLSDNLDILTPKITFNDSVSIGINAIDYNIGSNLPVVTDTWLGFGPGFSVQNRYFEVTLTSKF